jgi:phosphonate transport system substrate-binding protein
VNDQRVLMLGAVAYEPRVITIWEGFKSYFLDGGLPFDYVLFSNYERQVETLLDGQIDVAWNSPLAWIKARRMAASSGRTIRAVAMRDTDCNLTSVIVVGAHDGVRTLADLKGRTVAVGSSDSPQATLLPLALLYAAGLVPGEDVEIRMFDVLSGKHGDHVGGERSAAEALSAGVVHAACMVDANHRIFLEDGTLNESATRILARTASFDHCNFTVTDTTPAALVERFRALLLAMSFDDPKMRPLLELEGLTAWLPGRTEGYDQLEAAVDLAGFYDASGTRLQIPFS